MYAVDFPWPVRLNFDSAFVYLRDLLKHIGRAIDGPGQLAARGRAVQELLRLDVIAHTGYSPTAYGWHVDSVLRIHVHPGSEPVRPATRPPEEGDGEPPDDGAVAPIPQPWRPRRRLPRLASLDVA